MENFRPNEVLKGCWGLVKESKTLREFNQTGLEDGIVDKEIFEAAKEFYENWSDKTLIFIESLYFDNNHVIDLDSCKIKQFVAVATEEEIFYFFIKDIDEKESTLEDFFEDLADTNGDVHYGLITEEQSDKINELFGTTLEGDDLNEKDLVIVHSCDDYKICLTKDRKLMLLWSDSDFAEITEKEVTLEEIGLFIEKVIDIFKE